MLRKPENLQNLFDSETGAPVLFLTGFVLWIHIRGG